MIRLICALGIVLWFASGVLAAPFVVSDPYVAPAVIPDYFKVILDTAASVNSPAYQIPATLNYILHFDVGTVSVGNHTVRVRACKGATAWNPEVCSAEVPFAFTRPSAATAPGDPSGLGLSSQ